MLEFMFTVRNAHGSWSVVWASDSAAAIAKLKASGKEPKGFYSVARVMNVAPRESHAAC